MRTRITANTLIRVAVDALLEHTDQLHGDTEAQIRESVTSRVAGGVAAVGTEADAWGRGARRRPVDAA